MSSDSPQPKRILLVDDHPVVRDGLADAINQEPGLTVCAMAEDRHEALSAAEKHKPELMVIDLMLKSSSGLELIKDIHARWAHLPILVVSMQDEPLRGASVAGWSPRLYHQATGDAQHPRGDSQSVER